MQIKDDEWAPYASMKSRICFDGGQSTRGRSGRSEVGVVMAIGIGIGIGIGVDWGVKPAALHQKAPLAYFGRNCTAALM